MEELRLVIFLNFYEFKNILQNVLWYHIEYFDACIIHVLALEQPNAHLSNVKCYILNQESMYQFCQPEIETRRSKPNLTRWEHSFLKMLSYIAEHPGETVQAHIVDSMPRQSLNPWFFLYLQTRLANETKKNIHVNK